jgi:hypothetical protein
MGKSLAKVTNSTRGKKRGYIYDAEESDDEAGISAMTTTRGDGYFNFTNILDHRWAGNAAIELRIDWHRTEPSWESETALHRDAPDALFAYWKRQGGRPENPKDPGLYDIFAIREHSRDRSRLRIEWTGFPPSDCTWEPSKVVEKTAPELVEEYWAKLGEMKAASKSTKGKNKKKQKR